MPKIRTIKPEFWEDEKLAKLPIQARLLFLGTWTFADDNGVLRGNSSFIKSRVFPYDDALREGEVKRWIDALVEARMLIPFVYEGESYYVVRTFRSHQRIDTRYATEIVPGKVVAEVLAGPSVENQSNAQHVEPTACPRSEHAEPTASEVEVEMEVYSGGDHTHTVDARKGGVGGSAPASSEVSGADACEVLRMLAWLADRFPDIAAMPEPLTPEQLRWMLAKYGADDVRRILAAMHNKAAARSNANAFAAFRAFADRDTVLQGRLSKRADAEVLYTYQEVIGMIRANGGDHVMEDFTSVRTPSGVRWTLKRADQNKHQTRKTK